MIEAKNQKIELIGASKLFVCDEKFEIITDGGVVFEVSDENNLDHKILKIGKYDELMNEYSDGTFYHDSAIMPGFVNAHIHFEFGNNRSSFQYGSFPKWLTSVMEKRDEVFSGIQIGIKEGIAEQLRSGVSSVGAISSYGYDLEILANSPLRTVYFNEAIGSNLYAIDSLYDNFLLRYFSSKKFASYKFKPAVALHSPYSLHSLMAKRVLELAKKEHVLTSVHFLESQEEREWLEQGKGWFEQFYTEILNVSSPKPFYSIEEFLGLFEGLKTLFVHCLFATSKEFENIVKNQNYVISCPRSNRLLNNKFLDISFLKQLGINPIFATDGMSSNHNLNMLDELRAALFGYSQLDLEELSKALILGANANPAKALGLNVGSLEIGKFADIGVFECPEISKSSQVSLHFLLHSKEVKKLYINGKITLSS